MHAVVRLQLVLEAELLAAAVALVGFLARVDALVALECALIPEAAATELTLVRVVACGDKGLHQALASARPLLRAHEGRIRAPEGRGCLSSPPADRTEEPPAVGPLALMGSTHGPMVIHASRASPGKREPI